MVELATQIAGMPCPGPAGRLKLALTGGGSDQANKGREEGEGHRDGIPEHRGASWGHELVWHEDHAAAETERPSLSPPLQGMHGTAQHGPARTAWHLHSRVGHHNDACDQPAPPAVVRRTARMVVVVLLMVMVVAVTVVVMVVVMVMGVTVMVMPMPAVPVVRTMCVGVALAAVRGRGEPCQQHQQVVGPHVQVDQVLGSGLHARVATNMVGSCRKALGS